MLLRARALSTFEQKLFSNRFSRVPGTVDEILGLTLDNSLNWRDIMKVRIATLAVAGLLAATVPNAADARPLGMHAGFGHVGGWGGHGGWGWGGVGLGLATGALVGAALASPYYGYGYGYPYAYDYGYDYGYPVAAYDDGYYGAYAPAVSVGYVARPYWGHRRYYRTAYRPYAYGGAYRAAAYGVGYRARVGHVGYRHAGFRSSYGMARGGVVHHGRLR
jgi:hypothetical protein